MTSNKSSIYVDYTAQEAQTELLKQSQMVSDRILPPEHVSTDATPYSTGHNVTQKRYLLYISTLYTYVYMYNIKISESDVCALVIKLLKHLLV